MFEQVFTRIRQLTDLPYSDTGLREVDIELRIIHNVAMAAKNARRGRGRKEGGDFVRFSPTIVGAALGLSRQVVRAGFYALVTAGFHETRHDGDRVLFRPREIDHDLAEAFATYVAQHEELPTREWWSGKVVTENRDKSSDNHNTGNVVTAGGNDVTTHRSETYHANGETPVQARRFASEEVGKEEIKELPSHVTESPSPPALDASSSGESLGARQDIALGEDGMGYGCVSCGRALTKATVAEIRRRLAAGEDIPWRHPASCPE